MTCSRWWKSTVARWEQVITNPVADCWSKVIWIHHLRIDKKDIANKTACVYRLCCDLNRIKKKNYFDSNNYCRYMNFFFDWSPQISQLVRHLVIFPQGPRLLSLDKRQSQHWQHQYLTTPSSKAGGWKSPVNHFLLSSHTMRKFSQTWLWDYFKKKKSRKEYYWESLWPGKQFPSRKVMEKRDYEDDRW